MVDNLDTKKNRNKRRKTIFFIYKLIFFFVVIWFFGSSFLNFLISILIDTQLVEISVVEEKYPTKGYIIRDEITFSSPVTGRIIKKAQSGERVGIDMPIMEIEASSGTFLQSGDPFLIKAPISGVVSYQTDGLEEIFRPNELQSLNMEKIEKLELEIVDNSKKDVVEKGKRFGKIVNNLEGMQIYIEFPLDIFNNPLQNGQELNLVFPEIDKEISVPIIDLKGIGNTAQVLVELPEIWYSLINVRVQPVEIVLKRNQGIVLPKKALVVKANKTGVFWLRKGFVFWQPVNIISEDNENVVVGGLEPLTEVILNPGLVKEGQYVY